MKKLIITWLVLMFEVANAEEPVFLKFGYTEACPHMCPHSENKGFTADIARAIYEHKGYQISFINYPWARAARNTLVGKLHAVLSAGKEETPELLFPESEVALQSDCFYGKATDGWQATDADSFRDRKTIVFKGWVNEARYQSYFGLKKYQQLFDLLSIDKNYLERSVEMVSLGRVDAFWADINVFNYFHKNRPDLVEGKIKKLGCIKHQKLYIAFSPVNKTLSDQLAKDFDEGIVWLRESGKLAEILAVYGLRDWY